jgi:hypothetical protein
MCHLAKVIEVTKIGSPHLSVLPCEDDKGDQNWVAPFKCRHLGKVTKATKIKSPRLIALPWEGD